MGEEGEELLVGSERADKELAREGLRGGERLMVERREGFRGGDREVRSW